MVSGAAFFFFAAVLAGDFPRCGCCFSLGVFDSVDTEVAPLASSLAFALLALELLGTDVALRSNSLV